MIAKKQFDEIKKLTHRAVHVMLGFDLNHVGVNCNSEDEAMKNAARISSLFN
ncbi:MAG TPA: 2-dehydro-3-deoxyphosphogluconate aldolase, partial [Bacteroidetes bacterium]|nr:2-dehydro-3-deoxyphosphogluconate aldolase [Bacteroidota bacterium]